MVPHRVRRALLPLLLTPLLGLSACSEGAPDDASVDDFCREWTKVAAAQTGGAFRDVAAGIEQVGTPGDISSDGRAGFEVFIRVARDLDQDATLDELVDPRVSDAEAQQLEAFIDYSSETCSGLDAGGGL